MKDDRRIITEFCKIVQRFPDLYDHTSDTYRRWCAEGAWEKVADCVRNELHEECTVEELKMKWKGLRSSYNRYKNKVFKNKGARHFKEYYLHETLKFLDPFIKPKGITGDINDIRGANVEYEECYDPLVEENDMSSEFAATSVWAEVDTKPNITQNGNSKWDSSESESEVRTKKFKKRKREENVPDEDNEDLQFFKSILPDIKNFTPKEKRKLKMNILKLIDDIDGYRKNET